MTNNEVTSILNDLIQLDIDAVEAYEQAIKRIDIPQVSGDLETFKSDHERHIRDLTQEVRRLGGKAPKGSVDLRGLLLEGFTALRSVTGTEGALKAMQSSEKTTNKRYEEALAKGLPADVEAIVRRNREDERRHLEYIKRCLSNRVWETGVGPQPGA